MRAIVKSRDNGNEMRIVEMGHTLQSANRVCFPKDDSEWNFMPMKYGQIADNENFPSRDRKQAKIANGF